MKKRFLVKAGWNIFTFPSLKLFMKCKKSDVALKGKYAGPKRDVVASYEIFKLSKQHKKLCILWSSEMSGETLHWIDILHAAKLMYWSLIYVHVYCSMKEAIHTFSLILESDKRMLDVFFWFPQ